MDAVRADPGRAGAIALAVVAAVAIAVTLFTLARGRADPVSSANLPPVQPPTAAASSTPPHPADAAPGPAHGSRKTMPVAAAAPTAKPRALTGTAGTVHGAQLPGR